jgi:outer membrane protein TolC
VTWLKPVPKGDLTLAYTLHYGLTQRALNVSDAYKDPQDQQNVRVGITIPILDWGLGKGKVKMAQSNREVIKTTVQQAMTDFERISF